jgi:hypothetical protein
MFDLLRCIALPPKSSGNLCPRPEYYTTTAGIVVNRFLSVFVENFFFGLRNPGLVVAKDQGLETVEPPE